MKKNTFYALLFCAMLTGCAVVEGIAPSYDIAKAEAASVQQLYEEGNAKSDYIINLSADSITVTDPDTGRTVHAEEYESGSSLAEAILKDNE